MRPNDKTPALILDRISIDPDTHCWNWNRKRDADGYGIVSIKHKNRRAHRVSYEVFVGPIEKGLQLDHLCRNRGCCNPKHVEPVTNRENMLRGATITAHNATKTHCIRGHRFDEENTRTTADGKRCCKTCQRDHQRKRRHSDPEKYRRYVREYARRMRQRLKHQGTPTPTCPVPTLDTAQ